MSIANSEKAQQGLLPWQGALVGVSAGVVYLLFGFFLLRQAESPRMGETLFLLLPLIVGATIAMVTPRPLEAAALLWASVSLLICLSLLIAAHAEGILCAVIALPLIFVALVIGVGIGALLRQLIRPFWKFTTNSIIFLAGPVLVLVGTAWK